MLTYEDGKEIIEVKRPTGEVVEKNNLAELPEAKGNIVKVRLTLPSGHKKDLIVTVNYPERATATGFDNYYVWADTETTSDFTTGNIQGKDGARVTNAYLTNVGGDVSRPQTYAKGDKVVAEFSDDKSQVTFKKGNLVKGLESEQGLAQCHFRAVAATESSNKAAISDRFKNCGIESYKSNNTY